MRWKGREQSDNVEDRRGRRLGPGGAGGLGVGALVIAAIVWFMGGDPSALLRLLGGGDGAGAVADSSSGTAVPDERFDFASVVLKDTEDVWSHLFREAGRRYQEPRLVVFSGAVQSACGFQSAAVGPFYCPADSQVYLDLEFFAELSRRFGASGDFAQAYVIAHEIGHHVQNLLGTSADVARQQQAAGTGDANDLSVRLELQADFFAGVFAHHAERMKGILESGDVEEALNAAAAIGDDRLQKQSRGYVTPDSFTHGTSAQRVRWFKKGLETGDVAQGDTFSIRDP